jgi:hypothetical protein
MAKGITGQTGTFEEFGPEIGAKFVGEAPKCRVRKMIQRAMENVR